MGIIQAVGGKAMADDASGEKNGTEALWCYGPLDSFESLAMPVHKAAHRGFRALWDRIRQAQESVGSFGGKHQWQALPGAILDTVVPRGGVEPLVDTLEEAQKGGSSTGGLTGTFRVVLSPPHSWTPEALAGLALGFAFKDYVSSLIAGIVTLYEKPYRQGDWVEISGTYGEIRSIGMRALKLVTPDDTVVTIPHMKIWDASVFNANDGQRELQVAADFYLHPDHDGREVQRRLQDVAYTSPFLHQGRPVAVVASEKPWGTHYRLKAYPMEGRDQFQFATDMTVRGKAVLRRMGVRFAEACTFKTSE